MPNERVTKSEFIEKIHRAREEWDQFVRNIDREEMLRPGFCGEWSLKDVVAHITWYEREMVNLFKAHAFTGSPYWELPLDERNAVLFEENKDLPLEQVLRESREVFPELMRQLESLTDEDLNDPARFPGMPADWQSWQVIAGNTYEHYEAHLPSDRGDPDR